jgi:hypothetical protein
MFLVNVLVALLLVVSTAACVVMGSQESRFSSGTPSEELCAVHVPQALLRSPTFPSDVSIVKLPPEVNATTPCAEDTARFTLTSPTGGLPQDWGPTQGPGDPVEDPTPCDPTQCLSLHSSQECLVHTSPPLRIPLSAVVRCWCMGHLQGKAPPLWTAVSALARGTHGPQCRPFFTAFALSQTLAQLPGIVVTFINILMNWLLHSFTGFERPLSDTGRLHTLAVKTFAAQFLNTAVVILVVKVHMPIKRAPSWVRVALTGDKSMLGMDWYQEVGGSIVTALTTGIIMEMVGAWPGAAVGAWPGVRARCCCGCMARGARTLLWVHGQGVCGVRGEVVSGCMARQCWPHLWGFCAKQSRHFGWSMQDAVGFVVGDVL